MRFVIEPIACDGEAFGDWPCVEVARILRELASRIDGDAEGTQGTLRDANGNRVSGWRFES